MGRCYQMIALLNEFWVRSMELGLSYVNKKTKLFSTCKFRRFPNFSSVLIRRTHWKLFRSQLWFIMGKDPDESQPREEAWKGRAWEGSIMQALGIPPLWSRDGSTLPALMGSNTQGAIHWWVAIHQNLGVSFVLGLSHILFPWLTFNLQSVQR